MDCILKDIKGNNKDNAGIIPSTYIVIIIFNCYKPYKRKEVILNKEIKSRKYINNL